jgi:hypothetical protein
VVIMSISKLRLKCAKCGGPKFIGDEYYALGTYYVDVTCVVCADSVDISVEKLNKFLDTLERGVRKSGKPKTNP